MPRGRPKGSKNKSKETFDFDPNSENIWGLKEIGDKGIVWHHPLNPPFLSKEAAEAALKERSKYPGLKLSIVNMVERAKSFQKISVASSVESAILPSSETDGDSSGSETANEGAPL